MARGYRQVQSGDYLYRKDSRCHEGEYRVEFIVFDSGEPVKVAVCEVRQGTVANPGSPQHPQTRYWSLATFDVPLPSRGVNGTEPVTDAWGRRVRSASFDRMIREAQRKRAEQIALQEKV